RQRRLVLSVFERELAETAVIGIGRGPASDGFYGRTVGLRRVPGGARLRRIDRRPSVQMGTPVHAAGI
ncbi:MAG TPA: hypothetical protein VFG47_05775, partial [Geminicoccaceae bacterium]|nr:hypothetical protein [Geminicoccaceae bacterium]